MALIRYLFLYEIAGDSLNIRLGIPLSYSLKTAEIPLFPELIRVLCV